MSKTKKNVSLLVREMLRKDPKAKPRIIVKELAGMGIKGISATYVSAIKTKFTKTGGLEPGKRGRPRGKAKPKTLSVVATLNNGEVTYQALEKASALVKEVGSVSKAQHALQALAVLLE
jgi:hypothetical protein